MAHPLTPLFAPRSVAVFGASQRPHAVGTVVFQNLLVAGFAGPVYPINPKYTAIGEHRCYAGLPEVGGTVDLAVIATPAPTVAPILRQCGNAGVKACVVLSAGFAEAGAEGVQRQHELLEEARRFQLPVLGPNCLGLYADASRLNATFASANVHSGSLALLSQSGALCTAILDWADEMGIGFSSVVSVGDAASTDFGDLLDYFATDGRTRAVLLYIEGVRDARRFMSGLRVAARLKPTLVLKAGRHPAAAHAARTHTGALVGADDVFDAALRRAGAVRVETIGQLFATAQLLAAGHRLSGDRLAVVTNAGGPAVMSVDRAAQHGMQLSKLEDETLATLNAALPTHWSHTNPIDVLGDATPDRYRASLRACLADPNVDGALAILTPQAMTEPAESARAVISEAKGSTKPIVACWMGGRGVAEARDLFRTARVPSFHTPEAAVDAFHHLWMHHENQRLLLQAPGPATYEARHDVPGARLIVESALKEQRQQLTGVESKALLRAFGIPCSIPIAAATPQDALLAAENLGFPVALKLDSPDVLHKTDADGVRLDVRNGEDVRRCFTSLIERARAVMPEARIRGVTVEPMYSGQHVRELMIGVVRDPCFGPAISVGAGGTLVELLRDRTVGLPPFNPFITEDMLRRTSVARLLGSWRGWPAVDLTKIQEVLGRISDLVCELPEVLELDINPLLVDEHVALAVDARVTIGFADPGARAYEHMAIHPYPATLREDVLLADGTQLVIRPIRPEDAQMEQEFVRALSERAKYFRFMQALVELTPAMLIRFTQIDYDREMAFVAIVQTERGPQEIGVSRYVTNPDGRSCDFALVVADEWQRRGIGTRLMKALIAAARARGFASMAGEVLTENASMLRLVRSLGFVTKSSAEDPEIQIAIKAL